MTRVVLVTGTDTGVGKTTVAAALVARLRSEGVEARGWKPVETGCVPGPGGRLAARDGAMLAAASGRPGASACGIPLAEPLAPAVAAARAGIRVDLGRLSSGVIEAGDGVDLLLVEGAGGLLAPLFEGGTLLDLARDLAAPLLVVAANRLGVLNHAFLTVDAAAAGGAPVVGVVLVEAGPEDPADLARATNAAVLARGLEPRGTAFLGVVPHEPGGWEHLSRRLPAGLVGAVAGTVDPAPRGGRRDG